MKRFISVLMILVLTLGLLAGCSSSGGNTPQLGVSAGQGGNLDTGKDDNGGAGDNSNGDANVNDPADEGNNEQQTPGEDKTPSGDSDGDKDPSDKTPSNDKQDESKDEDISEDEEETIDPEAEGSGYLKVLSYNLRGLRFGPPDAAGNSTDQVRKEDVAAAIREIDADIVGLQELEINRARSGSFYHLPWLAEQCGYKYYYMVQTVTDSNGTSGEGHGIMSKYPITSQTDVWYDGQDGEKRKYGRVVLNVNGKDIVFYNTHLCTDNPNSTSSVSSQQFRQVLRAFYNEKGPTILTADFNITIDTMLQIVDFKKGVISLNGGPDLCFFNKNISIDNIYVRNMDYYTNPNDQMCIFTGENMMGTVEVTTLRPSDHIPLWGYVKFK